jgi:4a-hydroxytetrahydrobiopterin dehydratase
MRLCYWSMSDTPLTDEQIEKALLDLPNWKRDGDQLHRSFEFDDFKGAMAFMVRVAFEAEAQGHHPEWSNVYNEVDVRLTTHHAGDKITAKDTALAAAIDRVAAGDD